MLTLQPEDLSRYWTPQQCRLVARLDTLYTEADTLDAAGDLAGVAVRMFRAHQCLLQLVGTPTLN